jgi:hypothetical protein
MRVTYSVESLSNFAEVLLSNLWQVPTQCEVVDTLREEGRNRVYRLKVIGGPLESVILKASVGDEDTPYQQDDDTQASPFWRFCNEWAGSELLGPLGIGPKAIVGDATHGLFLMEDLGEGESLADRLCGNSALMATSALFAYTRSLGMMAKATRGKLSGWEALRRTKGATSSGLIPEAETWEKCFVTFTQICQRLGVTPPETITEESRRIYEMLENPGDYLAFTPSDCCPDNHFLRGDKVVFFDCEFAGMRHALLDLAYITVPFPTCWCTNRLPEGMPEKLIEVYQTEYLGDEYFMEYLLYATTYWTVVTLSKNLEKWLDKDNDWGLASVHQRFLLRLENVVNFPDAAVLLPGITTIVGTLYTTLQQRWSDMEPMPLYPAFRG